MATTPSRPQLSSVTSRGRRAALLAPGYVGAALLMCSRRAKAAPSSASLSPAQEAELRKAFADASEAINAGDLEAAEAAWSRAIEAAPKNAAAWSNRGALRLQRLRWEDAAADLRHAAEDLESGDESPGRALALNNYGNALVALGDHSAIDVYRRAARMSPEDLGEIAGQNIALALFQFGDVDAACEEARKLLRRDPRYYDARCALAAFLYATGNTAEAEREFEALQSDGVGAALYPRKDNGAVARVRNRWPPRATAALDAFLRLDVEGVAMDWNGEQKSFRFS